jgi:hypothetical protein
MAYLRVDEQATYIDVICDGYILNFIISDSYNEHAYLYDEDKSNILFGILSQFHDDSLSYDYRLGWDTSRIVLVLENTPNRVKILVKGQLDRSSGATSNYLANLDYITEIYTIYPDKYFVDIVWEVSGAIACDANDYFIINSLSATIANLTGEQNVYENSGSESSASTNTAYNSADYLGVTATEINVQLLVTDFPYQRRPMK